jgi:integrase
MRSAPSTQNQALCAILFLYKFVLQERLPWLQDLVRARRPERLPSVLTPDDVRLLLGHFHGTPRLVCSLLYGGGLRLLETLRLRVKDIDFARHQLFIRDPKGCRDRVTMLPRTVEDALRALLEHARKLHEVDIEAGFGAVWLPTAIASRFPVRRRTGPGSGPSPPRGVTSMMRRRRNGAIIYMRQ